MTLMTPELERIFGEVGPQRERGLDARVVAKYVCRREGWAWYAVEHDRGKFYGLAVDGKGAAWGEFSLDWLRTADARYGLKIERELGFDVAPLRDVLARDGHRVPPDDSQDWVAGAEVDSHG